ncbi:MAG: DUF2723 domain-containing protein [bacterium]|nr:DUF2723 domain-containing protein [bacterium]
MNKWISKLPALILLFIALIYFIYLPVSYDFDGTVFSQYLRFAVLQNDLITTAQPQHPLYIPLNYLIYKPLKTITGYNPMEYFHLQLFSLCFGLLTLWLTYLIIKKLTDRKFFQISGIALAAFCYGTWYYSVEAEVHMAGLFFVTAGVYLLFFYNKKFFGGPGGGFSKKPPGRTILAALCFALAAGFHLTNGLIVFSVLLIFIMDKEPFAKIFRFFLFYALFLLAELSFFALVWKINLFDFYRNQLMGQDVLAGYQISYWKSFSLDNLWGSVTSVAHGLVNAATPLLNIFSIILLLAGVFFIIWTAVKKKDRTIYYKLGAWMLPYFIFFTFWDHRNTEFKLNVILPFIILVVVSAASVFQDRRKAVYLIFGAFTLCIFLLNFYFFVKPANDIESNRNYQVAEAIRRVTPSGSIIVIGGCGTDLSIHNKIYISYFSFRKTIILDWMLGKGFSLENIRNRVKSEREQGTPVYFFSEIVRESKTVRQLLRNHKLTEADYFAFMAKLKLKEKISLIHGYYLSPYQLTLQ